MNTTALYRALVEAGTDEDLAKEAAESVVYGHEGATKRDIAVLSADAVEFRSAVESRFAKSESDAADFRSVVESKFAEVKADSSEFKVAMESRFAEVKADSSEFKVAVESRFAEVILEIGKLRTELHRELRMQTWRVATTVLMANAVLFAGLKLTAAG